MTVVAADVVGWPAASRATAVRLCAPLLAVAVFQDAVYGDDASSLPRLAPSSLNCTPMTPTLSEAVAVMLMVPETVAPLAGLVIETAGGVLSVGEGVVPLTIEEYEERFPTASVALTL